MAKSKAKQYTVEEIVDFLKNENETIEGQLLKKQLIRMLYKKLGDPQEKDFPKEYKIAGWGWEKMQGFTGYIEINSKTYMKDENRAPTIWNIQRPSPTKIQIVEEYTRAGWSCVVQAYNVMCVRYTQHPKYKDIWVKFYSSRDCNKYEYVICED